MKTNLVATLDDLAQLSEHQKAELINGELVLMSPTGGMPGYAAGEIFASLREYAKLTRSGHALADNMGFVVNLPHRRSFSPVAAYYVGKLTMNFLVGAPSFAVEVRSDCDYGTEAERAMAEKRADYFAAGTAVVWDVDLLGPETIRVYRASNPYQPTVFYRGDIADAEPALPGWRFAVDELFV
ncbi:MAG: Uma2 family endonuclease [Pirellulales bacterium]|nr:Uma2 family endonuclease [Pirellulales bacterium]